MKKYHLKITENDASKLKSHLHPGDGLESVAFGLCGRFKFEDTEFLFVHKVFLVPYEKCERTRNRVKWNTGDLFDMMSKASDNDFGVIKFHSHPTIDSPFSSYDDISDKGFFEAVYGWNDSDKPHGSVIVYEDGTFNGRIIDKNLNFKSLNAISIIGNNFCKYDYSVKNNDKKLSSTQDRTLQAFGKKTTEMLQHLKIGVIGCSGTGSPTIEQLYRLGVGELFICDPKIVKDYNLNRILGTTAKHVVNKTLKVQAVKDNIESSGLGTKVKISSDPIQTSRKSLDELASCDIIFGCVDSAEGRYYANLISTYYLIPLIDIGIKLNADGNGGVDSINGNIHYVNPGSESLMERKVFNSVQLEAEELARTSKEEFEKRQDYFDNITGESSPAVISVNMMCSSIAVNELLSRIHPFRYQSNDEYGITRVNLSNWEITHEKSGATSSRLFKNSIGVGDREPLINLTYENIH